MDVKVGSVGRHCGVVGDDPMPETAQWDWGPMRCPRWLNSAEGPGGEQRTAAPRHGSANKGLMTGLARAGRRPRSGPRAAWTAPQRLLLDCTRPL
eukprot:366547-Chlamydomonas_euryale.AAC.2